MRIFSPVTEYTVLSRVGSSDRRFVARDGTGNTRLLVVIREEREAKRLLASLMEWKEREAFRDFIEFFPDGNGLVAVFAYYPDGLSEDIALDDATYRQRAAVLRSLFALLLLQDIPRELLCEVLSPGNMLISRSGAVRLLYDLPCGGYATMRGAVSRIVGGENSAGYDLIRNILISELPDDYALSYSDIYVAADKAASALDEFIPPPPPEKPTAAQVIKRAEAVKEMLLSRWAALLALIVLIVGYAVVGLLFYNTVVDPPGVDNGIREIGTVVVDDDS